VAPVTDNAFELYLGAVEADPTTLLPALRWKIR